MECTRRSARDLLEPEIGGSVAAVPSPTIVLGGIVVGAHHLSVILLVGILQGVSGLHGGRRVARVPPPVQIHLVRAATQGGGAGFLLQTRTFGGLGVERRGGIINMRPDVGKRTVDGGWRTRNIRDQPIVGLDVGVRVRGSFGSATDAGAFITSFTQLAIIPIRSRVR